MSAVISVENVSKLYRLGAISHDLNRVWARLRGKPDPLLKIGQENLIGQKGGSIWAREYLPQWCHFRNVARRNSAQG